MEEKISNNKEVWEGLFATAIKRLDEKLSATGYSQRVSEDYIRVVKHFCYWHGQDATARVVDESSSLSVLSL